MSRGKQAPQRTGAAERLALEVCARTLVTRGELQDALGRSKSNVTKFVNFLKTADVLDRDEPRFRNLQHLQLGRDLAVLVGVDFEQVQARFTITDATYSEFTPEPVAVDQVSIDNEPGEALMAVAERVAEELDRIDGSADRPVAIGLSVPAPIDRVRRTAASPEILGNLSRLDPANLLSTALADKGYDARVTVHNDASLGAIGLRLMDVLDGAHPPLPAVIYLRVTNGVGCGFAFDGELFEGETGLAGEFGHLKVDEAGELCPNCGGVGCLETIAANPAILAKVQRSKVPDMHSIGDVITSEHRACARALRDAGWQIGCALSHAYNLLNPSRVVVGGEASQSENFMDYIDHALQRDALAETLIRRDESKSRKTDPAKARLVRPEPVDPEAWLDPELAGALAWAGKSLLPSVISDRVRAHLDGAEDELDSE